MTAKNINAIDLVSRALAGMRFAADVPTMPRCVLDYLAPFAHLSGDNDAVSFLVEAMQAEAEGLLSKQAESDNNWKCPKCGGKLTVVLDCTNRHCEWYSMTGAELRSRLSALEAENARLKAENAQHDWWGGGGR